MDPLKVKITLELRSWALSDPPSVFKAPMNLSCIFKDKMFRGMPEMLFISSPKNDFDLVSTVTEH